MKRTFDASSPEMVDLPDADPFLLRDEMNNLRKINRRFGGISAVRWEVAALASNTDPRRPLHILDLATGSADVPLALVRYFSATGRPVRITAVDRNEVVLEEASGHAAGTSEILFVRGNILELDYPDEGFDIALCSLALHHFDVADAVRIISEMERLSRVGFVLCDLRRSYAALWSAWLYTRLTTRNIMTRTDAIASVRASFTENELRDLLARAGVGNVALRRAPGFRLVATHRKK
jgi:ubiquinone/menaquinone biosynthesis C-methylase UbiE